MVHRCRGSGRNWKFSNMSNQAYKPPEPDKLTVAVVLAAWVVLLGVVAGLAVRWRG